MGGLFSRHAKRVEHAHLGLIEMLSDYHRSGAYARDLEQVGQFALDYLQHLTLASEKSALVLDIDETSLMNKWPDLVDPENGYDKDAWEEWIQSARAPAISSTLELFNAAKKKGIDIFFISGRHPDEIAATITNLHRAGYGDWKELIGEPVHATQPDLLVFPEAASFKTAARWSIVQRGYDIVLSMGDQQSDIEGGFAEKTFKLPNPFYTII